MSVGSVWSQQSNTIYVQLVTNGVTSPITTTLGSSSKIGQSGHVATSVLGNAGVHTCNTTLQSTSVEIRGSFDNSTWFTIGPVVTSSNSVSVSSKGMAVTTGQGMYPFLEVLTTNSDTTNCLVNTWYSGSVANVANSGRVISVGSFNSTTTTNSNNVAMAEKSQRLVAAILAPVDGGLSTTSIVPTIAKGQVVIDCVDISLVATGTVSATFTANFIINDPDVVNTYIVPLSVPTGSVIGTMVNKSVCGLNIPYGVGNTVTLAYDTGITHIKEYILVTYYFVQN